MIQYPFDKHNCICCPINCWNVSILIDTWLSSFRMRAPILFRSQTVFNRLLGQTCNNNFFGVVLTFPFVYSIGRKPPRECLVLVWRNGDSDAWCQLIIVNKEKVTTFNCVEQLKSKLSHCFLSAFSLTHITGQLYYIVNLLLVLLPSLNLN